MWKGTYRHAGAYGLWIDTGKDYNVQELKDALQASNEYIQTLQTELYQFQSSLRQGIKRPYIWYRNFYSHQKNGPECKDV